MVGDGIPPIILKHSALALIEPIHHLFSLCLTQLIYLSNGVTTGLFLFLRLVINLLFLIIVLFYYFVVSQVLEKLLFDKIYDFVVKTFISHFQFGFIKNCSSLKQLLVYSDFLFQAYV